MQKKEYSVEIGGKTLTAIFTDLAEQAHGSVMLKYGETIVLATACMSHDSQKGLGFFNLTVDYVERFYASGKISGSRFVKREGKPSEDAILASRVIDRTLRPLFNQSIRHAVQVIVTVISVDDNDSTILAVNAASLALAVSNIPWNGPIGCVRIGKYDPEGKQASYSAGSNELIINPSQKLRDDDSKYKFDLTVCGKNGNINMIEASAHQTVEAELEEAFTQASKEISRLEDFQKKIVAEIGKEKRVIEQEVINPESVKLFNENIFPKMPEAIFSGAGKAKIDELHNVWNKIVAEKYPEREDFSLEDNLFDDTENDILHDKAINENKRADGRKMNELRDLFAQAGGISIVLHGSGIFYRGGTHVLSVLTLGGPEDRHMIDGMQTKAEKRFMHHYNFPPYSSGETGRAGFTNRREVGHGALAEKALAMVLPSLTEFPYTIRVVSESMASNGSTSQASICASTLALMDGGVPIVAPVAGIAMGLMMGTTSPQPSPYKGEGEIQNYKILTDIQGPEDHYGDMDFKVAGTREGVTAIQLDVKVEGVPIKILGEAMIQAKDARVAIIDRIEKEIAAPRKDISPNAPKILIIKIQPDMIGMVIGGGGKTIKEIKEKSGAEITIEDNGTVYFTGKGQSAEMAKKIVEEMTREFKVGEVLKGEVVKVADFGAFVQLNARADGMVHISEIAPWRVERVSDIIKEGMIVPVKVISVDREKGRIGLSIKEADKNFFDQKHGSRTKSQ
ncbi:polyribonucleotide nucleotidyltransferase [Candidatus Nomurabacteria bacterium RIFCSPHIGHO2_01_FULL_39_220]|uniref:Polyribonucleotide nucleotidyltransferase n=1 Tax=Candidatus Nomurabacteria bacterium RIFCSPLOWO2_02_FULL_40_67 TaxID=1801787 RepID=A0A1F6Y4G6_9BACT|nr:MAG: Polyribonucleotide nucleotidyltransferase [Parcubacteria group bacterium GW2011_GWA2_40_37]OGI62979.1 MAG: polyribonucleotide nucleotidyltransferase [Candidatus Nomurabacteria bacterium RBG_16_40_11]OGI69652.1 MAG: polyribonucleotide nucleotidyltransferase [Candidatus Nomurabacteria bacterium RIFCSPHIGHO2_01_FULL_39_220]OGI78407.1 MAG: polyribonucleotide nucleotidyltransferase [Candidatus Nomurabacteria bacterium RIFCSPHIGHO2_02_FULL_41_150]OGI81322.1 MAG: polyribonucleotide nucleotidyl